MEELFTPRPHSHEFRVAAINHIVVNVGERAKQINEGEENPHERWLNTESLVQQALADLQKEQQLSDYTIGTYRRAILHTLSFKNGKIRKF